jgi:hypothetical protein
MEVAKSWECLDTVFELKKIHGLFFGRWILGFYTYLNFRRTEGMKIIKMINHTTDDRSAVSYNQ